MSFTLICATGLPSLKVSFLQGMFMGGARRGNSMAESKLVIDVVDNGGQWTHREWRMLRYLGVDTQIIENTTPVSELRELDGLILSGGAARIGLSGELGNCAEFLDCLLYTSPSPRDRG